MTTDAVARLRVRLSDADDDGEVLVYVPTHHLRDVLDRIEQTERERDEALIVAINDGQKLLEMRERLEAAERCLAIGRVIAEKDASPMNISRAARAQEFEEAIREYDEHFGGKPPEGWKP